MLRVAAAFALAFLWLNASAISLGGSSDDVAPAVESKSSSKGASGTDATDLWWNPAESGWGMQLIQNHTTVFATIYTYNASGQPTFFVGVMTWTGSAFAGELFASTGPYFGGPWNPAAVSESLVGTITVTPVFVNQIDLAYTVNGVAVGKPGLRRLALANDNLSGSYEGVSNQTQTCTSTLPSGTFNGRSITATISHGGDATLSAFIATSTAGCSYIGNYLQTGRFGQSTGTFNCDN